MSPRRSSPLVALLVLFAAAACAIVDTGQPSPEPFFATGPPRTADPVEVRRVQLAVANGYDRPYVEFGDADHGYALFASCGGRPPASDCPALLLATADGGRSWHRVPHPRPLARQQRLQVTADVPVLYIRGEGWYFSLDDGSSFQHERGVSPPSVVRALRSWIQLDDRTGKMIGWHGGVWRPLPVQPPLSRPQSVYGSDGLVVAASVADGRPLLAVSFDSGAHWLRPRLSTPDGEIAALRVAASDAGDVWLIGERRDPGRFPALWHYDGEWRPVIVDRYPEPFVSLVPFGQSRLAVSGPVGGGLVTESGLVGVEGGHYGDESWPLRGDHRLTLLSDGTVLAHGPEDLLLGVEGGNRWVRVLLERRRPSTDK